MKKTLTVLLMIITMCAFAQDKKVINGNEGKPNGTPVGDSVKQEKLNVESERAKAQEAITNLSKYYDISEEGSLYPKGTFPRKQDTTKIVVLCSTLDKVTGEDGSEFTNPKIIQKVMYVINKPNSLQSYIYLDENKKPVTKDYIFWQTKEFPKK